MNGIALLLLLLVCTHWQVVAENYQLQERYAGFRFFDEWTWETFQDPTHGRVNYVDIGTAINRNLSYGELHAKIYSSLYPSRALATGQKFVMRADHWNRVTPLSRGRDSVRIRSKDSWGDSLLVLDLEHMPEGCGTWPAFWTLSEKGPWPAGGEIDILEGKSTSHPPNTL